MNNSSDDSSDWSSAEELEDWNQELNQVLCLFCDQTYKNFEQTLVHLKSEHNFDLIEVCVREKLTSIDFIKLINYIRANKPKANQIEEIVGSGLYDNDVFMRPVLTDDRLLTYDIESDVMDGDQNLIGSTIDGQLSQKESTEKVKAYEHRIEELERQLKQTRALLSEQMVTEEVSGGTGVNVAQMSTSQDEYYVSSYSHYSIHYEMLNDTIRTKAYEESILNNRQFFEGKTVLDIGCGTGILSLFAAKAGAHLVVAVDHSDIIYKAIEFAVDNHLDSKIKFLKGKFESIDFAAHGLPLKYDIIVSEWMGYFLLFEGMLDTILYARNRFLSPSGLLMPNTCSLSLAGICDRDLKRRFIDFWDDVYGFKMSTMKNDITSEAHIETVDQQKINTSVCLLKQFDLMTVSLEETQSFETPFELSATSDEPVLAFVAWFDTHFNSNQLTHCVTLSTSPFNGSTHWKQTLFMLKKPIECKTGDKITGHLKVYRNVKDVRSLVIELIINGHKKQLFFLS